MTGGDLLGDAGRTCRYLRERRRFVPRPDDIYVASYPRSGTTRTQHLIWLLLHPDEAQRPLSAPPGFRHIADVTPWFERDLARGRHTAEALNARPGPRVFKTHLGVGHLPRAGRVLYLTRPVEDVVVSYHHLYRTHLDDDRDFAAFFRAFLRGDVQYRCYFKHNAAYQRAARRQPRVLRIDYDELCGQPAAAARRIAQHLGLAPDEATVDGAVARTHRSFMKTHEACFDHATVDGGAPRAGFIRAAAASRGDLLTPAMRQRLARAARRPRPLPHIELRLPAFLH